MPRNPNYPNHNCGLSHSTTSAGENIKLQLLASKLESQLREEFLAKTDLKTINLESLIGEGNCHNIVGIDSFFFY